MRKTLALMVVLLAACSAEASKAPAIPFAGRVTDQANLLTDAEEAALSTKLAGWERRTAHQMVIVTVTSLNGQDILFYSVDLARAWGIGRKGHNDGVVILVAPNERKARIEIGYGLEKALPDDFCAKVMREKLIPHFIQSEWKAGLDAGIDAITARAK